MQYNKTVAYINKRKEFIIQYTPLKIHKMHKVEQRNKKNS